MFLLLHYFHVNFCPRHVYFRSNCKVCNTVAYSKDICQSMICFLSDIRPNSKWIVNRDSLRLIFLLSFNALLCKYKYNVCLFRWEKIAHIKSPTKRPHISHILQTRWWLLRKLKRWLSLLLFLVKSWISLTHVFFSFPHSSLSLISCTWLDYSFFLTCRHDCETVNNRKMSFLSTEDFVRALNGQRCIKRVRSFDQFDNLRWVII